MKCTKHLNIPYQPYQPLSAIYTRFLKVSIFGYKPPSKAHREQFMAVSNQPHCCINTHIEDHRCQIYYICFYILYVFLYSSLVRYNHKMLSLWYLIIMCIYTVVWLETTTKCSLYDIWYMFLYSILVRYNKMHPMPHHLQIYKEHASQYSLKTNISMDFHT